MTRHQGPSAAAELSCDVCGRLPLPRKSRVTLANVAAMLPIELAVHAVVVRSDLSYLVKVLVLTVTATVLVIWVAEPSATRLLRSWLHAPTLRERRRLHSAQALWRVRTTVRDRPGELESLTRRLAELDANILDVQVHPTERGGTVDELVLATSEHIDQHDLVAAVDHGGGRDTQVWPTTALALVDGQTKALNLAVRVTADPAELPLAVAELLRAQIVTDRLRAPCPGDPATDPGGTLKVPSAWRGAFVFSRPGEPFTPAESARAHRLAELAEMGELRRRAAPVSSAAEQPGVRGSAT